MAEDPIYGTGTLTDLQKLLQGLNLLGQDISQPGDSGEHDPGASSVESVATMTTKVAGTVAGTLGITTAGFATWASRFWSSNPSVHSSVVWALAIAAAAAALTFGIVVSSDLRARARGQGAMYDARKAIAVEFIKHSTAAATTSIAGSSAQPQAAGGGGNGGGSTTQSNVAAAPPKAPLTAEQVALVALAAAHQDAPVTVPKGTARLRGIIRSDDQSGCGVQLGVHLDTGGDDWVDLEKVTLNEETYAARD